MSDKHLHTFNHSWRNMIIVKSLLIGSLGLNPNTLRRGESSRRLFYCLLLALSGLNWLGDINGQGMPNNRGFSPRSGKLADYTRLLITWVSVSSQHRIEQLTMWNVVQGAMHCDSVFGKGGMALKDDNCLLV